MVKSAFCVYNESGRIGDTYQVTEWAWRAESGNKLELVDVVSKQLEECIIFRGVIGLAELVPPLDRPLFDPLDTDSVPFWSPNCR
jgi:hypothetical protein